MKLFIWSLMFALTMAVAVAARVATSTSEPAVCEWKCDEGEMRLYNPPVEMPIRNEDLDPFQPV